MMLYLLVQLHQIVDAVHAHQQQHARHRRRRQRAGLSEGQHLLLQRQKTYTFQTSAVTKLK